MVVGTVAVGLAGFAAGPDEVEPVCERPEDLQTRRGIKLTADAMEAFRQAEAAAGQTIEVVHSYRSCRRQARACKSICGSRRGCPGTCAPPGLSWHQRGAAVDITQTMLETPGVVDALEQAGWCQAVPESDPGHFSYEGCH
jgi:LAS superfamily LD-carboxypeptidase LdcB